MKFNLIIITLPGWFRMAANMIGVQPFSSSQSEDAP